jgi:hypothetical protein
MMKAKEENPSPAAKGRDLSFRNRGDVHTRPRREAFQRRKGNTSPPPLWGELAERR